MCVPLIGLDAGGVLQAKWLRIAELVNGLVWQLGLFDLSIRVAPSQLVGPHTDDAIVSILSAQWSGCCVYAAD